MGDAIPPPMRRRDLLGLPVAVAGGLPLAACALDTRRVTAPVRSSPAQAEVPVTPPEDLMREHGVLKRILLIYREAIRRSDGGERFPARSVHDGARIIRSFIEQYHERLEEQYVFPPLLKAGRLTDTVTTLRLQHQRGRVLTGRIIQATTGTTPARHALVADMTAFIRMYEPHEAREDTVVFPAFREVVPAKRFSELGEIFEDEEHRRFGARGFTGIVDQVAEIEKGLRIYDLAQFTPRA